MRAPAVDQKSGGRLADARGAIEKGHDQAELDEARAELGVEQRKERRHRQLHHVAREMRRADQRDGRGAAPPRRPIAAITAPLGSL